MATPREKFGRDYAASIAATMSPRAQYYRTQAGAVRSGEALDADITGFYDPALRAAAGIGENVANVGRSGLAALAGLQSSLPGFESGILADAARSVSRAGGTAALTSGMMGTSARAAMARDRQEARRRAEQERNTLTERAMEAEVEAARVGADWLPFASQRQQMETAALQNRTMIEELRNVPVARRRALLENRLLTGQVDAQILQNAQIRKELKKLGFTDKQLNNLVNSSDDDTDEGDSSGGRPVG